MRSVILVWMAIFGLAVAAGDLECYRVAHTLQNLQNRIVRDAFLHLEKGDWARYADGTKAVYLGERRLGEKTLSGIEIQMHMPMQIWYEIVPKDASYAGRKARFLTIDPTRFYLRTAMGTIVLEKSQIGLYSRMTGGNLSTIFTPAQIKSPPDCSHLPQIQKIRYRFPSGRSIDAVKIVDKNNGFLIVSDTVPFGIVEAGSFRGEGNLRLTSFGHHAKILMRDEERRKAQTLPVISIPENFPLPTGGGI
ncbi:MAG TPA: hypothetical protein ENK93_01800 [Campylobacteraceae bacterium]|nr:hypothetical protein [Campylobacteraceae bacterium]HHD83585.1 hypothetical protein [Campylobacteraceae bacterium]